VWYELSPSDTALVYKYARLRSEYCTSRGLHNKQVDGRKNLTVHIEGLAGEIAWCRQFGYEPDLKVYVTAAAPDVIDRDGRRIDVKATHHSNGDLCVYVPGAKDNNQYQKVDIFVSTRVHLFPRVDIRGWAHKVDVVRQTPEVRGQSSNRAAWYVLDKDLHRYPGDERYGQDDRPEPPAATAAEYRRMSRG
jgi:hypothetical protein